MKNCITILIISLVVFGCGQRTVPVSSDKKETSSRDSVVSNTIASKDSSYFKETVEEKILPEASVGITLSKSALDSLIVALGKLPSSVTRTVYYRDPTTRAELRLALDSLNNLVLNCSALEQRLLQVNTDQVRYIRKLETKISTLEKSESHSSATTLKQEDKWFTKCWKTIRSMGFLGFFILFVVAIVFIGLGSKLNVFSIIKKIFFK